MSTIEVSFDTEAFEVPAELDERGRLSPYCAAQARKILDEQGFVLIPGLLSEDEATVGLKLVKEAIDDPNRAKGAFASETDIRHRRRDFCPLPSTTPVLSFASLLCRRLGDVLLEYCGRTRQVLEISTLTSNFGSSHQYIHRDPSGVFCMFAAVDEVSREQGGTMFVPGTHRYSGARDAHDGMAERLMELFRARCNIGILRHNLAHLWRVRKRTEPPISWRELRARVFSKQRDDHQPNLARFFLGANDVFSIREVAPHRLLRMLRYKKIIDENYRLVQATPAKGTVILYRSDMLHAGPDNRTPQPRYFFNINIARDVIFPAHWRRGYSPHPTLLDNPISLGDLLDRQS
jgi:Phytanoyl-CoA dioxygenase (PhyH)